MDKQTKEDGVALVAEITDAAIRANILQDQDSIKYLMKGMHENPRVLKATSNPACFASHNVQ